MNTTWREELRFIYIHFWYVYKALFGKWGEHPWRTPLHRRLFYRFKAAVCMLFNIEPSSEQWRDPEIYEDLIHITYTNGGMSPGNPNHPDIYWYEAIVVTSQGWWATVHSDSSD